MHDYIVTGFLNEIYIVQEAQLAYDSSATERKLQKEPVNSKLNSGI